MRGKFLQTTKFVQADVKDFSTMLSMTIWAKMEASVGKREAENEVAEKFFRQHKDIFVIPLLSFSDHSIH